jgi:hypothetical protein
LNAVGELRDEIAVVGLRSIGTTLSAVTSAAARKRGLRASRITVRPHGHPYNRETGFTREQLAWIAEKQRAGAAFFVVDEGPGLSGSSFISVAEALARAGVPHAAITLVCGHQPEFDSLRAENGSHRARQFRWFAVTPAPYRPAAAQIFIGGGQWRRAMIPDEANWPASWTSFERLKYFAASERENPDLLKFMGFGRYGAETVRREETVADAGFGHAPRELDTGFVRYPWLSARPMQAEDISTNMLTRMAQYCAFRATAFATEPGDIGALQRMAEHNLQELKLDLPVRLRLQHPVIADARMQPHEWLLTNNGEVVKIDSGTHGDDHFFPGATDIAWDLAGAIVECAMPTAAQQFLVAEYQRASGDDPRLRLSDYINAYAVFRASYCTMAANAMDGAEQARLERAAAQYTAWLVKSREAAAV